MENKESVYGNAEVKTSDGKPVIIGDPKQEDIDKLNVFLSKKKERTVRDEPIPFWPNIMYVDREDPGSNVDKNGDIIPTDDIIGTSLYIGDIDEIDSDEIKIYTQLAYMDKGKSSYLISDRVPTAKQEVLCYNTLAFYSLAAIESVYLDNDEDVSEQECFVNGEFVTAKYRTLGEIEYFMSPADISLVGTQAFRGAGELRLYAKGKISQEDGEELQSILDEYSERYVTFVNKELGQEIVLLGFTPINIIDKLSSDDTATITPQFMKNADGKYFGIVSVSFKHGDITRMLTLKTFLMDKETKIAFMKELNSMGPKWLENVREYTDITTYRETMAKN